jgi:hypothetical protein
MCHEAEMLVCISRNQTWARRLKKCTSKQAEVEVMWKKMLHREVSTDTGHFLGKHKLIQIEGPPNHNLFNRDTNVHVHMHKHTNIHICVHRDICTYACIAASGYSGNQTKSVVMEIFQ